MEDYFPEPTTEEIEQEERQFWIDFVNAIEKDASRDEDDRVLTAPIEDMSLDFFYDLIDKLQLTIPDSIKLKLRTWSGRDAFEEIKKTRGQKYALDIIERIHQQIPLSLKGFSRTDLPNRVEYSRKFGDREITLWVDVPDLTPAAGDLAKRVFMGTFRFAGHRETLDPGPIEFKELLEMIDMLDCSQREREIIKDALRSFSRCSMTIRELNAKGEEIFYDYAPFFKRFIWMGKTEYGAKIFPVFNEELFKMLADGQLGQYIFIDDSRLGRIKGLTDRDRLAQDQFKIIRGFRVQRIKMKNWLYKFGQFTDTEIRAMSLKQIKGFVNKNFTQAKKDGLVKSYKISRVQKKSAYLNSIILIYPSPPEKPKPRLTEEQVGEIKNIAASLHEYGFEEYANKTEMQIQSQLIHAAEAENLDCIIAAWNDTIDEHDPENLVNEDRRFQNLPMLFWEKYREYRDAKQRKKK